MSYLESKLQPGRPRELDKGFERWLVFRILQSGDLRLDHVNHRREVSLTQISLSPVLQNPVRHLTGKRRTVPLHAKFAIFPMFLDYFLELFQVR
jgi:hypothetical protein